MEVGWDEEVEAWRCGEGAVMCIRGGGRGIWFLGWVGEGGGKGWDREGRGLIMTHVTVRNGVCAWLR